MDADGNRGAHDSQTLMSMVPESWVRDDHSMFSMLHRPNIWPEEALPELDPAFKELGRLIMDVGLRLTEHCDQYVARCSSFPQTGTLQQILLRSPCPKVSHLQGRSAVSLYMWQLCVHRYIHSRATCHVCRVAFCTTSRQQEQIAAAAANGVHGIRTTAQSQVRSCTGASRFSA